MKPYASSKIIIFTQVDDKEKTNAIINAYKLVKLGEDKIFAIYQNPYCQTKISISRPLLSFGALFMITLLLLIVLILVSFSKINI